MDGKDLLVILLSYGLGCLATGYYLVRWRTGQNIQHLGSGSIGARNVGRILGRRGFCLTLTGDILKGAIAIWIGRRLDASPTAVALSVTAVAAGHIFPIQLRFHGGKGIAVSLGALLILDFRIAAGWIFTFVLLFVCCRRYMLSGILSIFSIPIIAAILGLSTSLLINLFLLTGLILLAHRKNIFDPLKSRTFSNTEDHPQGGTQ